MTCNSFISVFKASRKNSETYLHSGLHALSHPISCNSSHLFQCLKSFFHIASPSHTFMVFPLDKSRLKFLLTMPSSYFFLPQHAKSKHICQRCCDINKKKRSLNTKILFKLQPNSLTSEGGAFISHTQCDFGCPSILYMSFMSK